MAKNDDEKNAKELHETPHDAYVRVVLIHPGLLGAQLRAVLPEAVWRQLDLEGAETKAARFIDERLKALESDAVFEVSSNDEDVQVFVLLEHQRTAPWHMPLRVLRYVTGFWQSKLTEDPTRRRLPLVIPLVVANVPGGWRGPRRIADLLEGPPALVAALAPLLPRLELVIDDLATLDLATVLAREGPPAAKLMWWALSVWA
ncbi:MAG: Rpn family recombination-promoting nuclease/putative transposase [Myxococcaceae bacterium]|nr:Rpn family recombination-promoting nuclease/putative transposase [Myxococcaceae bacterium]